MAEAGSEASPIVMNPEQFREHWQGHRRLSRRMIDAFPEKELFDYSIGGMRTFAQLAAEMIGMGVPTMIGVTSRKWPEGGSSESATTKADLLRIWDESTAEIDRLWKLIPPERFQEVDTAFGQWEMPIYGLLLYVIDNEIHHRGQGYVYLRSLGIDPPPFYER